MTNLAISFVCGKQGNHAPGVDKYPGIESTVGCRLAAFFISGSRESSATCFVDKSSP
jgi:hypothetical protein